MSPLHMLTCGFVCAEVFGWEFGGRRDRLATLLLGGFLAWLLASQAPAYLDRLLG